MQRAERRGNIFGAVAIDLADKAQRQVKLIVVLPARGGNAVHRGAKQVADGARRTQGDEQAVARHGPISISIRGPANSQRCILSGFA
jgi:hypothetical protein